MKNVTIVSKDVCVIKQITNIIKSQANIKNININDFENQINKNYKSNNHNIYFIDIDTYEYKAIEMIEKLKKQEKNATTIIITLESKINYLLKSTLNIFACVPKSITFSDDITQIWNNLQDNQNIISNGEIPIIVNFNNISSIYKWPNNLYTIKVKNNDNDYSVTFDKPSKNIEQLQNDYFYQKLTPTKKQTRNNYNNIIKQIAVDLYIKFKINDKTIGDILQINPKNIKRWASITKYQRKIPLLEYLFIKYIIYKYKKRGDDI